MIMRAREISSHLAIIYFTLLIGLIFFCNAQTGLAKKHHFIPRYYVSAGLSLASEVNRESQRQLPWRELNNSALMPSRANLGVSYQPAQSKWFAEFSLRLFRLGFEAAEAQIKSFKDPKGKGVALGELSLRYIPKAHQRPRLLLGHFILSTEHSHWTHQADHFLSAIEYNGWLQEDPSYSLSVSPLDRFVLGASLMGHIAKSEYRVSVATPSSNSWGPFNDHQESGLLFDLALGVKHQALKAYFNLLYAHQLRIQDSTLNFIDQRLAIQALTQARSPLQGNQLKRNSLWLNFNLNLDLGHIKSYQAQFKSTIGLRNSELTEYVLSPNEEAALAESQLIGVGLNSRYSIMLQRIPEQANTDKKQRWPDLMRLSYLWRDPHTQFAFDERHRSLLELIYHNSSSSLCFWWQHLWSANRNRWSLANDLLGISLEFTAP